MSLLATELPGFAGSAPLAGLAGGVLIGLAAALMLLGAGRIAGVSGIAARAFGLASSSLPHAGAWAFLIGLPLGGWLAGSYFGRGVDVFGIFSLPALPVGENPDMGKTIIGFHKTGGEIFIYLIALHILGALKHTFFDKNGGIFRMLPFGKVPG